MTSIPLFFDSRKGQETSENFVTSFNPPLQLNIKKSYEMALISSQIWYSWHNITVQALMIIFIIQLLRMSPSFLKYLLVATIRKTLAMKSSI